MPFPFLYSYRVGVVIYSRPWLPHEEAVVKPNTDQTSITVRAKQDMNSFKRLLIMSLSSLSWPRELLCKIVLLSELS
uniref:Uncharacterized protein n=1 Tax=Arundo donax TaxID=35708 RepID=A0A0A9ECG0_ARUDO